MRVMMIGPYPRSPDRIDGGAASALTYLSEELANRPDIRLVGVRIADTSTVSRGSREFDWPIIDLRLGRLGLTTLYQQQRRQFGELLRCHRPDIVHAQGIDLPGYLAVSSGAPSVVTVHGILGEETRYGADAVARIRAFLTATLLEKPTVRHAPELISISPYVTQHYGQRIRGRVHEIPNAISSRYFDVERKPEKGRWLFAGRIIRRKGVVNLVQAFGMARGAEHRLVFAGAATDAGYEQLVREEISRLHLNDQVEFRGLLDESEVLDEFARAEALVLPSYQETAPMVIQQAMAAGLAVVATRICGVPHQIEHDVTGLMYTAGVVEELAALLKRLRTESTLAARLGNAARKAAAQRYHAARVAGATVDAYRTILERSAAS